MKKVLVTGATGFIGSHVLDILIANDEYEVHAITSKATPPSITNCIWHPIDLMNSTKVEELLCGVRPTHLLHFAWYTTPGEYWTSTENFSWVQASLELLRQFKKYNGQKVVMAGSCAEYDWNYGYCSEFITPTKPNTPYGTCKQALQNMLEVYSKQTGLSSAWGRNFFIYGPHEHPERLIPSVIRKLLLGEIFYLSHSKHIRDFLYVEDVADAFVSLLESDVSGPVNVASGEPIMLEDIVSKVSKKLNRQDLIKLSNENSASNEPHLLIANVDRLHNEVDWEPKWDLERGLDKTIEWWKKELDLKR